MTDKELADRVVALGVGIRLVKGHPMQPGHKWEISGDKMPAEDFVRDWRVAGALMEKCKRCSLARTEAEDWDAWASTGPSNASSRSDSLPRAIVEACVEALSNE